MAVATTSGTNSGEANFKLHVRMFPPLTAVLSYLSSVMLADVQQIHLWHLITVSNMAQSGREDFRKDASRQFHQPFLCATILQAPILDPWRWQSTKQHLTALQPTQLSPVQAAAVPAAWKSAPSTCTTDLRWKAGKKRKIDVNLEMFCLQGKPLQSQCQAWAGGTGHST